MGTYNGYIKEYEDANLSAVQKRIKEQQDKNTATSNQYVADINAVVDKNIANSVNKVQGQIDTIPMQYQSSFDANAVQQKINERQAAEQMANLGLTNSGLNRTQQTAFAVQRSNADAALRQQMNAATNSLKQQIADLYASGESQKAENLSKARYELEQKNQSAYDTAMENYYSSADAYANARIDADAQEEAARIKAEQEAAIAEAEQKLAKQKYLDELANNLKIAQIEAETKKAEREYNAKKYQDELASKLEVAQINAASKEKSNYTKWALENGYGYDKNGNLVYKGGKIDDETFDEAYELYDPNNETAFYDYIEKLELLGYGEDVLAELVTYVVSKKGKSVQRAWQGPIYQPNATVKKDATNTVANTTNKTNNIVYSQRKYPGGKR